MPSVKTTTTPASLDQSYEVAAEWFLKAAEKGDVDACRMLDYVYRHGQGVEANVDTANFWKTRLEEIEARYGHLP